MKPDSILLNKIVKSLVFMSLLKTYILNWWPLQSLKYQQEKLRP